jgi:hypothetical protein
MAAVVKQLFEHVSTTNGPVPGPIVSEKAGRLCREYGALQDGQPFAIILREPRVEDATPRDALVLAVKPSWSFSRGAQMLTAEGVVLWSERHAKYHRGAIEVVEGNILIDPRDLDAAVLTAFGQENIRKRLFGDESASELLSGRHKALAAKLFRLADRIGFVFNHDPFPELIQRIGETVGAKIRILKEVVSLANSGFARVSDARPTMRELRQYGFSRDEVAKLLLVALGKDAERSIGSFMKEMFTPSEDQTR